MSSPPGDDDDDVDRTAILARRGKLVSAAMAGLMAAACSAEPKDTQSSPRVCLTIDPHYPSDQPPPTPADAGTPDADTTPPMPCLSIPAPPNVCLSLRFVEDAGTHDADTPRPCLTKVRKP